MGQFLEAIPTSSSSMRRRKEMNRDGVIKLEESEQLRNNFSIKLVTVVTNANTFGGKLKHK